MSQLASRPPGVPWLSPYLTVRDARAALDFYARAFGFQRRSETKGDDDSLLHVEMSWQEALIMFGPEGAYGSPTRAPVSLGVHSPVGLYVYCDDVDTLWLKATTAGAQSEIPPTNMFWGDRMCKLIDPDGHVWSFATHQGE